MTVNLTKSRTVFFPEIPGEVGKNTPIYLHFSELQDEMAKQVVGLFDNDAALRDALNTAVSVAVTTAGDMVVATGTGWGILPIGSTNQIMFVNGTQPSWIAPATLGIPTATAATTGAMFYMNKTTGWDVIAAGSEGQHLIYKTDSGRGVWTTDLGPTNAPTATDGKMLLSSNSSWVTLSPGVSGNYLMMGATIPVWTTPATASGWSIILNTSTYLVGASGLINIVTLDATGFYKTHFKVSATGSAVSNKIAIYINTIDGSLTKMVYVTGASSIVCDATRWMPPGGFLGCSGGNITCGILKLNVTPINQTSVVLGEGLFIGSAVDGFQPLQYYAQNSGTPNALYFQWSAGVATGTIAMNVIVEEYKPV